MCGPTPGGGGASPRTGTSHCVFRPARQHRRRGPAVAGAVRRRWGFVLNGHDHVYERFAELGRTGLPQAGGMREIIVGTGGSGHYAFDLRARLAGAEQHLLRGDRGRTARKVLQLEVPADRGAHVHRFRNRSVLIGRGLRRPPHYGPGRVAQPASAWPLIEPSCPATSSCGGSRTTTSGSASKARQWTWRQVVAEAGRPRCAARGAASARALPRRRPAGEHPRVLLPPDRRRPLRRGDRRGEPDPPG